MKGQDPNRVTCATTTIGPPLIPHNGIVKALIIFFKYSDDNFNLPPHTDDWPSDYGGGYLRPAWTQNMLSPTTSTEHPEPSLSGYFHSMSLGNFEIIGDEYPQYPNVYRSAGTIESYRHRNCGGQQGISWAIYEAITNLDAQIDYRQYDNDGPDGIPNSGDDDGLNMPD
ncbi:MAG: hypothetical protein ACRDFC_04910 [Ignavibacteria bacterium]